MKNISVHIKKGEKTTFTFKKPIATVVMSCHANSPIPRQHFGAWTPRDIHAPNVANVKGKDKRRLLTLR